jgi:hypothetical protein
MCHAMRSFVLMIALSLSLTSFSAFLVVSLSSHSRFFCHYCLGIGTDDTAENNNHPFNTIIRTRFMRIHPRLFLLSGYSQRRKKKGTKNAMDRDRSMSFAFEGSIITRTFALSSVLQFFSLHSFGKRKKKGEKVIIIIFLFFFFFEWLYIEKIINRINTTV